MLKILVVEDDTLVRESLREILVQKGHSVSLAADGEQGLAILKTTHTPFNIALIDLRLPGMTGIDFLEKLKVINESTDCVMMTSFATVETAVEAMKMGAAEYITKPINDDELQVLLEKLTKIQALKKENTDLKNKLHDKRAGFHHLIGCDEKFQKIYSVIEAISDTDATVLVKGESGTGKGMIAQAIHKSDPVRKEGPYIEVSCGAIPRELLESELFGHVKGSFTSAHKDRIGRFELANGGTILLDEIDSLPPYLQVKLLRVLQQKTYEMVGDTKTKKTNVRIIAATNRDLEEEIKKGNFREDLYYRLNVISIKVPPLKDRKIDIPALTDHFLKRFVETTNRELKTVSDDALKVMLKYDWPGNVRELENTLERLVILTRGDVIRKEDLSDNLLNNDDEDELTTSLRASDGSVDTLTLKDIMKQPEKKAILSVLEQTGWNRKKTATILNINRTTLYNKMKEHELL